MFVTSLHTLLLCSAQSNTQVLLGGMDLFQIRHMACAAMVHSDAQLALSCITMSTIEALDRPLDFALQQTKWGLHIV